MSDENLFREAISITLQHWPSFQIAVSNGMGGSNTEAKIEWMCDSIAELFTMNEKIGIQIDEVLDYVTEVINNEFDTIIEDGSEEMVCSNLVAYYKHIRSGNKQFVVEKLDSLKQKQALLDAQRQQQTASEASNTTGTAKESTCSDDIEMKDGDNVEDDGWTVVRRKK